jgi:ATP-dependent protease ClpP protease subunit
MVRIKGNIAIVNITGEITLSNAGEYAAQLYGLNFMEDITSITLIINTIGGSVVGGFDIINAIKTCEKPVKAIIGGIVASIGAVIALSCDKIESYDYGLLMIHNPSGGNGGLDKVKDSLMKLMSKYFKDEDMSKMMDKETWFDAKEMKKMKIIDKIISTKTKIKIDNSMKMVDIVNLYNNKNIDNNMAEETVEPVETETVEEIVEDTVETVETVETEEPKKVEDPKNEVREIKSETLDIANAFIEIKAKYETLLVENETVKNELKAFKTEEEKDAKMEVLKLSNISEDSFKNWLDLDLDTIKNLVKTIVKETPKIINGEKKEGVEGLSNLSPEAREQLFYSDPELFAKMWGK